ncbi:MAG: imelysin family protein, partial [Myxococcota bacterium]
CTPPQDAPVDAVLAEVLGSIGGRVVRPALAEALVEAQRLDAATATLAQDPTDAALWTDAQEAWRSTMTAWHRVELMQIGPIAPSSSARGGADGRDNVYSWPTTNPCRVDQETVIADFDTTACADGALVHAKRLDALAYLLWAGPDNACPSQIDINANGTWDALSDEGVLANRAQYAAALSALLVQTLTDLDADWLAFEDELKAAGQADTTFPSGGSALNAIYDAMFYLETRTKDVKLAHPTGLRDCDADTCADDVEHGLSGLSTQAIQENLAGFSAMLSGNGGKGFNDVLIDRGHGDLAEALTAGIADAQANADALRAPLDEIIRDDVAIAVALHDDVKVVTDLLKGDVATVLSVSLPSEAAGDND